MDYIKEAKKLGFSNTAIMDTKNSYSNRNTESFVKKISVDVTT